MIRGPGDYPVFSFDCYGTLIDWETGLWEALQPLLGANDTVVDRDSALTLFSAVEPEIEAEQPTLPYSRVLELAHSRLAARMGLATDPSLDEAFGASVPSWPAFPDTANALAALARHHSLVILSNVDHAGFAGSLPRLGVEFAAVYTAEDIGSYKPDPANFEYLIAQVRADLGHGADNILHVAQSLFHDHVPARAHGLATAWIDRQGLQSGGSWGATRIVEELPEVDYVYPTLAELAAIAYPGLAVSPSRGRRTRS